jgi:hypothetical protein
VNPSQSTRPRSRCFALLAPRWEVDTARAQTNRGDPDAGLSVEERAAKHGLGNAGGVAGSFQKTVGWVGANDGFLVLDEDVNRVAGNGAEMFNNPLVAEAGRGLRLLEAYDANGDGIINAADPVYGLLQVWRDLDQDGNNLQVVNGATVQDSTNGQFELTSLASAGITGIDYNNSRYLSNAGFGRKVQRTMQQCRSKASSRAKLAASLRGYCVMRYESNSNVQINERLWKVAACGQSALLASAVGRGSAPTLQLKGMP